MKLTQFISALLDPEERNIQGAKLSKERLLFRLVKFFSGIDPDGRKAKSLDPVAQPSLAALARALEQCQGNQGQ
jgi:hypothetical protein